MSKMISVLMAVYNCENTVKDAIDSIVNQTYNNWELIVFDDCSQDSTYDVVLKIAEKDSRIKVYRNKENLTLAPTLNECLKKAEGEYVARMDGDDVCDSLRFEKEIQFLENNSEYAIVSCLMDLYDDNGVYGKVKYKEFPQYTDLINSSPICHAGCMMRKDVLEKLGGYNTSLEVERIEDYDLWRRLFKESYKAYNIQEYLYSMRDDRNAISRKKFKFRVKEYKLKKKICDDFNLPLKDRLKCFRPIILGLMPSFIYVALHKFAHRI